MLISARLLNNPPANAEYRRVPRNFITVQDHVAETRRGRKAHFPYGGAYSIPQNFFMY